MSEPPAKKLKQSSISSFFGVNDPMSRTTKGSLSSPADVADRRRRSAEAAERRIAESREKRSESPSGSPESADSTQSPAVTGSQSLFSDDSQGATLQYEVDMSLGDDGSDVSLTFGCASEDLLRFPACAPPLPTLEATPDHSVLFNVNDVVRDRSSSHPPRPYPASFHDRWDGKHVRMPCSAENVYPGKQADGSRTLQHRWKLVKDALSRPLKNSSDIERAILSYNSRYANVWNFTALHQFLGHPENGGADSAERALHLARTIPSMAKLALRLPELVTGAVPLLRRGENRAVSLTQEQVACLLANAFFCTFPRRNAQQRQSEYANFPAINFNRLYAGGTGRGKLNPMRAAKLRCLLHYFHRVTTNMPSGVVTFQRCCLTDLPQWGKCQQALGNIRVCVKGTIEDDGDGCVQVRLSTVVEFS